MNLVFVFSHLAKTGTNVQHYYLLQGLLENSKNFPLTIEILTFKFKQNSFINDFCRDNDIKVHDCSSKNRPLIISYIYAIFKLRSLRPDRVISYGFLGDSISMLSNSSVRLSFIHSTFRLNYNYRYSRVLGNVITSLHLRVLNSMTDLLSISESVRSGLLREGIQSRLVRNSFGCELNILPTLDCNQSISFATISSRIPGKNVRYLCDYFKERPHMQLIVYGDFKDKNMYQCSNIHFKGYTENLLLELSKVKFFISASLHEGLPNAVIEALYAGCIVILSGIPAHVEISRLVEGKNCLTFDESKNFDDLNRVMSELKEYKAESSHIVQSIIHKNLNIKLTVEQFLKAIKYV